MLTRDQGCRRDLLWRLELRGADLGELAKELLRIGWRDRSLAPEVRDLESPEGHAVVLVPRTGRVQLRVFYLTPHSDRNEAARNLQRQVLELVSEATHRTVNPDFAR